MRRLSLLPSLGLILFSVSIAAAQNNTPRNLILFVPDGLRGQIVTAQTAPAMAEVRDKGVNFRNSHSLFPTFTTANASAMATGHYLGDTGDFSNTIYTGYPVGPADGTVTPFLEVNPVIIDADEHFGGDYLNEETVLKMARTKGYSTAAIGKLGPTLIFDHTDKTGADGLHSIVIDDSTGGKNGVPLSDEMKGALTKANLPLATPSRGENGKAGDAKTPGTTVAPVRSASMRVPIGCSPSRTSTGLRPSGSSSSARASIQGETTTASRARWPRPASFETSRTSRRRYFASSCRSIVSLFIAPLRSACPRA